MATAGPGVAAAADRVSVDSYTMSRMKYDLKNIRILTDTILSALDMMMDPVVAVNPRPSPTPVLPDSPHPEERFQFHCDALSRDGDDADSFFMHSTPDSVLDLSQGSYTEEVHSYPTFTRDQQQPVGPEATAPFAEVSQPLAVQAMTDSEKGQLIFDVFWSRCITVTNRDEDAVPICNIKSSYYKFKKTWIEKFGKGEWGTAIFPMKELRAQIRIYIGNREICLTPFAPGSSVKVHGYIGVKLMDPTHWPAAWESMLMPDLCP